MGKFIIPPMWKTRFAIVDPGVLLFRVNSTVPDTAPAFSVIAIDIFGLGFTPTTVGLFNGQVQPSDFITANLIRITTVNVGAAGLYSIGVRDGPRNSNSRAFIVT